MAKKTRLVRDDSYEGMAAAYQALLASLLNDALKEHGVSARKVRRAICQQFLTGAGTLHDQCWFTADGKRAYPLLCFAEEFPGGDAERLGTVHAPSEQFSFAEYAGGNVVWLFDEQKESAAAIETGAVEAVGDDAPAEVGANDTDDGKEWALSDGTEFSCWLGGTPKAGSEFYLWASGPAGPVEYRIRRGKEVVTDWARLRKQRDQGLGPMFRATALLGPGKYAIDFRVAGEEFSALKVKLA